MKTPKISVLTPVYNTNPEHLREMIESVLGQTYTDFEFILLNDSPDNKALEQQILSYKDERIRYEKNERNIGISASRNKLLTLARGEYLAILDHDDICAPDRFEKEVRYLDENPGVGVVSGNITYFPDNPWTTQHPQENDAIKLALLDGCYVVHTAAMIRKSVLDKNDIHYEEVYSPSEDYMLWIRLMGVTMFHNLPDVLVQYRWYATNTTNRQLPIMLDKTVQIKNVAYKEYPYSTSLKDCPENAPRIGWITLFACIPLIKTEAWPHKKKYYLFGFLPILKWKRKK